MNPFEVSLSHRKADDFIEEKEIKRTRIDPISREEDKKIIHLKRSNPSVEKGSCDLQLSVEIIEKIPQKLLRSTPEKLNVDDLIGDMRSLGIRKRNASSTTEELREFKTLTLPEEKIEKEIVKRGNKRKENIETEPTYVKQSRSEEKERYAKYKRKEGIEFEELIPEPYAKEIKTKLSPKTEKTHDTPEFFENYSGGYSTLSKTAPFVQVSENIPVPKQESHDSTSLALFGTTVAYTFKNTCLIRDISDKKSKFEEVYSGDSPLHSIEWLNSTQILISEVSPPRVLIVDIIAKEAIKQFLYLGKTDSKLMAITRLSNTEFLTGDSKGVVRLCNVKTNTSKECVEASGDSITSIVPSVGGPRVAIGFQSGKIKVFDSIKWGEHISLIWSHKSPIKSLSWFPRSSNTLLAAGGKDAGELFVYDLAKKEKLVTHKKIDSLISNVIFIESPLPEFVVTRGDESKVLKGPEVEFYQISNGQIEKKLSLAANAAPRSIFNAVYSKSCNALIFRALPAEEKEGVIAVMNITRAVKPAAPIKESWAKGRGSYLDLR